MIFTWDWKNTCVIFKWWHIRTKSEFFLSFIGIVLLSLGYELSKHLFQKWERKHSSLVLGTSVTSNKRDIFIFKVKRSLLYGLQVGYSFMLMLVFMTYNAWLMIAVVIGAAIGNYFWCAPSETTNRSMACH